MLEKKKKQSLIKKYQTHDGDTGSNEVQIAILTAEIEELVGHLKQHPKDHSSRRGLLRKVSSRRHLMRYLKKENPESYEVLAKKLKIRQPRIITKPDGSAVLPEEELAEEVEITKEGNEPAE
jgi:small subunit ribosomal protein S15